MVKSGLISAATAFVLVVIAALVAPLCGLCVGVVMGLVAGVLAGVFDAPHSTADAAKAGGGAGGIAGLGALSGQMLAAAGLAAFFPEGSRLAAEIVAELQGSPAPDMTPGAVWAQQLAIGCCVGLLNAGFLAGLGAAAGAIWYRVRGSQQPQQPA